MYSVGLPFRSLLCFSPCLTTLRIPSLTNACISIHAGFVLLLNPNSLAIVEQARKNGIKFPSSSRPRSLWISRQNMANRKALGLLLNFSVICLLGESLSDLSHAVVIRSSPNGIFTFSMALINSTSALKVTQFKICEIQFIVIIVDVSIEPTLKELQKNVSTEAFFLWKVNFFKCLNVPRKPENGFFDRPVAGNLAHSRTWTTVIDGISNIVM